MRHIVFSSVACPALPHVSTFIAQTARFSEKIVIEHKMPVLIFSTDFV
jgi:hypothetical protein